MNCYYCGWPIGTKVVPVPSFPFVRWVHPNCEATTLQFLRNV